jgi:hypothetical protein
VLYWSSHNPSELRISQASAELQISVQVVSWPLVKKLAEPDAGLPGHKVTLVKLADHSVVAEKFTDVYGTVLFDVPAGTLHCARDRHGARKRNGRIWSDSQAEASSALYTAPASAPPSGRRLRVEKE